VPKRESSKPTEPTSQIAQRRSRAATKGSAGYQERRREISRAAAEVFNRRGFRDTSLSAVADELGMDRATLYYYIGSKRELFDEVVREASERNVALAESVKASTAAPLEKLHTLIVALMQSYAEHYPLLFVYMRENLSHADPDRSGWSEHMRTVNRRYERAIISIVQAGIDDGSIRVTSSAKVIAFGILGMVGWTNRWYVPGRTPESADEIGNAYADIIVRGLNARSI
jgi:TetR/AcrR family transcriptional regulator, cholesterol catabolism regulator